VTQTTLAALIVVMSAPGLAPCQDEAPSRPLPPPLHRIDARTPEGLRRLFRFDAQAMPLVSAHRGGAQPQFPENCVATFEHTLQHTFSILEIDLQYTRDGLIVLNHDPTLDRTTTGTGPVADRTLRELKQLRLRDSAGKVTEYRIATLDEVLEWARGKTIVILDKKNVPVAACVKKIEEHQAEAYAMVMAYSVQDIQMCHTLNKDIMMEVMLGDRNRFRNFGETGVPWSSVVAFVGHTPPQDKGLLEMIHAKGACCMAGTSRNLDRELYAGRAAGAVPIEQDYRTLLKGGVDLIETDLPIQLGSLLYAQPAIPLSKSRYFCIR
jgi:glycerophosphoryl diester phosphodiesterase